MMMFFGKHREIPSSLDNAIDFRHFLTIPVTPEHIIYSEDKWKMVVSTKKGRKRMRHILSRSVIEYDYGNRNNLPNEQQLTILPPPPFGYQHLSQQTSISNHQIPYLDSNSNQNQ
ncbi:MAG: hypothetical protein EZS28_007616, partial [Streblomastix strix]